MPKRSHPKRDEVYRLEPVKNTTGICFSCHERLGEDILLVPYNNDPNYMKCPNCFEVIDKDSMYHKSVEGPLGKIGKISSSKFEVVGYKRRIDRGNRDVFRVEDYPMTPDGREDSDLRQYANMGIIVAVEDDNGNSYTGDVE